MRRAFIGIGLFICTAAGCTQDTADWDDAADVVVDESGPDDSVLPPPPPTPGQPVADDCTTIDFNSGGGVPLAAGTVITNQFAAEGISSISCTNPTPGHPDKCIIFDSTAPTGGDDDLGTPNADFGGPGIGLGGGIGMVGVNDTDLGNLLIVAEDDVDADQDGLVDDPDDEACGGSMEFTFTVPVSMQSVTLVDIEVNEPGSATVFHAGGSTVFAFGQLGDNSVQELMIGVDGVTSMELKFGCSGGLAAIDFCPVCDCDETEECIDFMCVPKAATVGGSTFIDSNQDGVFNGADTFSQSVPVELFVDVDQNGEADDPLNPDDTAVSDAAGNYAFTNVNPFGTYAVGFTIPAGYQFSPANQGTNDDIDSDVNPANGYAPVATFPGEVNTSVWCGFHLQQQGGGF